MSERSKIEWTDATWNPWIGCTKVSPGCAHCYAELTTRARVLRSHGHETWGKGKPRSRTSAATWRNPVKWNREAAAREAAYQSERPLHDEGELEPYRNPKVFSSLCDWLDDEVPIAWLADFLKLIHETPHLDWLLLTKRPEKWETRITEAHNHILLAHHSVIPAVAYMTAAWLGQPEGDASRAPANVWLGTSVENQEWADKRIPRLLSIPAKVRFLSVEPMLGPIDLKTATPRHYEESDCGHPGVDWVIFGGESGDKASTCSLQWIRDGVKQCQQAKVAVFVKQLGAKPIIERWPKCERSFMNFGRVESLKLKDRKGGDMAEWPEDLRVREFPEVGR